MLTLVKAIYSFGFQKAIFSQFSIVWNAFSYTYEYLLLSKWFDNMTVNFYAWLDFKDDDKQTDFNLCCTETDNSPLLYFPSIQLLAHNDVDIRSSRIFGCLKHFTFGYNHCGFAIMLHSFMCKFLVKCENQPLLDPLDLLWEPIKHIFEVYTDSYVVN